jgi:hypothetical protein
LVETNLPAYSPVHRELILGGISRLPVIVSEIKAFRVYYFEQCATTV